MQVRYLKAMSVQVNVQVLIQSVYKYEDWLGKQVLGNESP